MLVFQVSGPGVQVALVLVISVATSVDELVPIRDANAYELSETARTVGIVHVGVNPPPVCYLRLLASKLCLREATCQSPC